MRCGGEVWVSSSFSGPSPNRHRAGQGRGVHFHALAPSLPPSLHEEPLASLHWPCFLAPGLGPAELGPQPWAMNL